MSKRMTFWAGFSLAVGAILAVSVIAFAGGPRKPVSASTAAAASPSSPPAQALAALQRPRKNNDALPQAEAGVAASLLDGQGAIAESARPGALLTNESRLLLTRLGVQHARFYAFLTSKGGVCYVITAGPAGCAQEVSRSVPAIGQYDPDRVGAGTPMAFYGLLPNDATAVDIVVDGNPRPAVVAQNAFFYQLGASDPASANAIVIKFRDASAQTLALPEPPGRR